MPSNWTPITEGLSGQTTSDKFDSAFADVDTDLDALNTGKENVGAKSEVILSDVTGVEPVHAQGQMYYANGILNFQDGIDDVTLQVGREIHLEVVNNSGLTIPNGTPVRHNGVTAGQVQIVEATADSFTTARVLGVATHDIADGATGVITRFGIVGGIDTSALQAGVPAYLDVTGGYNNVAPDIATQVGGVLVSAVDGQLFVSIEDTIALPTIYGNLSGGSLPITMTGGVAYDLDTFTAEDSVVMVTNTAAGLISCPVSGKYRFDLNIGMLFDGVGNAEVPMLITLRSNDGLESSTFTTSISRDSSVYNAYPSPLVNLTVGKDYHVRLTPASTLTNVSVDLATFDLTSVHIR